MLSVSIQLSNGDWFPQHDHKHDPLKIHLKLGWGILFLLAFGEVCYHVHSYNVLARMNTEIVYARVRLGLIHQIPVTRHNNFVATTTFADFGQVWDDAEIVVVGGEVYVAAGLGAGGRGEAIEFPARVVLEIWVGHKSYAAEEGGLDS